MRALRYEGPSTGIVLARDAAAEAREGEALIRPLRIGIGFPEVWIGARKPDLPSVTLGREFVGVVEQVNVPRAARDKSPSLIGRRVVASPNIVCGECDLCQRGLSMHCRSRAVVGVSGRDGCLADRIALPLRNLHPVPNEVDDDHAVFALPLADAIHCLQQLRVEGKPYITILGDGCIALLCAQLMRRLNASVRIVGRHESRLEMAEKWGVKHRVEREVGRRADQDVVVDCTGTAEGLSLAMLLVRPRGKILIKGPIHPALAAAWTIDLSGLATKEIEVIGSRCGPVGEAVEALRRGEVDVVSMITKRMRLDHGVEAVRVASSPGCLRVLVEP